MEIAKIKQGQFLIEEFEELEKYKHFIYNSCDKESAHFEIRQHYGSDAPKILFAKKYNSRFLLVVEQIILDLKTQIENL